MASKSRTGRRKKTTGRKKNNVQQSFVADEIIIWLTLAASILLLLSIFGLGGLYPLSCLISLVTVHTLFHSCCLEL